MEKYHSKEYLEELSRSIREIGVLPMTFIKFKKDFIITRYDGDCITSPEIIVRLDKVTEEYKDGYLEAMKAEYGEVYCSEVK